MKPDIKFIATDMDGSLLDDNKQLPDDFFDVFAALKRQNILFAAASGRQYESLLDTFIDIKDEMLFIADNGTLVMHQGKELYSSTIEPSDVTAIIQSLKNIPDCHVVFCGKGIAYIETCDAATLSEVKKYYAALKQVDNLLQIKEDCIKIAVLNFNGTEEHIYPSVAPLFSESHQVVVSSFIWLDFMAKDASKGSAIKYLQQKFNFTAEQSLSFGDYFNDVEMLQQTYYSYAMENAHPDIKQTARFSAPTNNQAGVTQVIRQLLLD
ncbi:Cof-type HAD-IIB family hydrolase [Reinekea thalattae]|uniref:HAD family hydrolase n=1 Tax=Reinekea thalattae TaxID=2593301 RepID=A0A5C8Z1K0_9GAMM|nr:Cof-type HAD-IIB family hydrolase [Reinekea thalattae]TXR52022.1 HAD family hydrolase [Reinekea thalattae]